MNFAASNGTDSFNAVKTKFLNFTGLKDVEVKEERVGHETFLQFVVNCEAVLYRRVLSLINHELDPGSKFHGRVTLEIRGGKFQLKSQETELLRSLIERSLRVTSNLVSDELAVEFAPFRSGEEQSITQPANHIIRGRRGVGKSSLILLAYRKILSGGDIPVWVDLEPFRGSNSVRDFINILKEVVSEAVNICGSDVGASADHLSSAVSVLDGFKESRDGHAESLKAIIPSIHKHIRDFTRASKKNLYVFLDDVHFIAPEAQPQLFDMFRSVFKGAGAWLNIAGVKNLTRIYDPNKQVGLEIPHDAQPVDLDLTLTDPGAAKAHLVTILDKFLSMCGIQSHNKIISNGAIQRLVWCSAGVPRDFLWVFRTALSHALHGRRSRIGVQEVNMATGEYGSQKMTDLAKDTTEESGSLQDFLDRLQNKCLDDLRSNSFLIRQTPSRKGYQLIQKLMDLRLVHLLHPSITPGRAGERYEAYLLDYAFYTGIRRRQGLRELQITGEPLKYAVLRRLPRVDAEGLVDGS